MTPEVSTRLKEITVDPKTVVVARGRPVSVTVPKVAAPLTARNLQSGLPNCRSANNRLTPLSLSQ